MSVGSRGVIAIKTRSLLPVLIAGVLICLPVAGPAQEGTGRAALTLAEAIDLALARHPALAAREQAVAAREAAARQAGRRPNPALDLEVENIAGGGELSGLDGAEITLALSHDLELGGKRDARVALARSEREEAAAALAEETATLRLRVVRAFAAALVAARARDLAAAHVEVAREMLAAVGERVRAGAVSSLEERRAGLDLAASEMELTRAEGDVVAAGRRLAALWGAGDLAGREPAGALESLAELPAPEALAAEWDGSPAAETLRRAAARLGAAANLARAEGAPDLSVGGGVRWLRDADAAAAVVGISLPLPLDRNRDGARAAELDAQAAASDRDARRRDVRAEVAALCAGIAAAREVAVRLRDEVLPSAEEASRLAGEMYRAGRYGLTDVLDTRRAWFDLQGEYLAALATHHALLADLDGILGRERAATLLGGGDDR